MTRRNYAELRASSRSPQPPARLAVPQVRRLCVDIDFLKAQELVSDTEPAQLAYLSKAPAAVTISAFNI
jgi:hypothetical protein